MSLRDTAYEEIKHRIITCDLKPGEVISEAVLSDALGIGRTPVHQAVDRLMIDGLLEVLPRKGVVVRPISLDEVFDIIDIRLVNEVHCVRRAAEQAEPSEIILLDRNLERMWQATKAHAIEDLMHLDREFHALLANAARNTILVELLRNLHDRSLRFWFISLRANEHHRHVCEQHAAIVEGIRRHDADRSEQAVREHIQAFHANVTRQL